MYSGSRCGPFNQEGHQGVLSGLGRLPELYLDDTGELP